MSQNVAAQLVEMLANAGVKRIYAVTGDSLNEVNNAVRKSGGKIEWIHVRHEEAGAYAAAAEAELSGLACCAGSSGPGHVHLINGLYDAHRSGAPVIAIASTCATTEYGMGYFQETNTIKLFEDCSHYNQVAATPAQLPRMLQAAIQHALVKKGVAVLGLPGDVTSKQAVSIPTSMVNYHTTTVMHPPEAELQTLATLLNNHQKIVIYGGIGCEKAHDQVVALAKRLQAPVAYSFRGKMFLQYENPHEVGMTGLLGLPSAFHAMHGAEVLLLLGTDFPYSNFMPEHCTIVQIDTQAERIGRRAAVNIGLCGTVEDTLTLLLPMLHQKNDDSFLQQELHLYDKVKKHQLTYVEDAGKKDYIHPEFIAHTIDRLADDDAVFTVDTGMCCVWGARYITATGKRRMLGSFNHGSMANAMPQAIGAALTCPGRQVIAFCGDGGISMLLGDLATIAQYKLPVKLMVFNNRSLGMVKLEMEVAGLPDWQTDMYNPDFAMIAEAMGIKGFTLKHPEEAAATLQEALSYNGPALVNIFTDPNALAMPPEVDFQQVKGMVTSMVTMLYNGNFSEVSDTIKANYKHFRELL